MKDSILNEIGLRYGTDKSAIGNDYFSHYERLFSPFRNEEFTIVEIGVAKGASLRTWQTYFPHALIVGIDIDPQCISYRRERVNIEIGSQTDRTFMEFIGKKYSPRVVIDDGSHVSSHNMISFSILFSYLELGGYYIIEDLYLHSHPESPFVDDSQPLPVKYFLGLSERLAEEDLLTPSLQATNSDIRDQIEHIEFLRRAIVIQKSRPKDAKSLLQTAWQYAIEINDAHIWQTLSTFALRNGLDIEKAADAARRAIALEPQSPHPRIRLAHIMQLQHQFDEALKIAQEAQPLAPDDVALQRMISSLRDFTAS